MRANLDLSREVFNILHTSSLTLIHNSGIQNVFSPSGGILSLWWYQNLFGDK